MGNQTINVKGTEIVIFQKRDDDFISPTDIARHKNPESTGLVISHWLSTRYTVEFLDIWEQMHNPIFNVTEFSNIKSQSGSKAVALRFPTKPLTFTKKSIIITIFIASKVACPPLL